MSLPKIIYNAGAGNVTLQCVRGPRDFRCGYKTRAHDNLATSGLRERVFEANDILISFVMEQMAVTSDLPSWTAFAQWALSGGAFKFYPDAALSDYYNCVSDDDGFEPARTGPGRYSAAFHFRIVPDGQAPDGGPGEVLERFYGIAAT